MSSQGSIRDYKDLEVWQVSMQLAREVYRLLGLMPRDERFALSDQMRRCVVSLPLNIAEGYGRGSRKEYCQFIKIARGSAAELETQLLLTLTLGMLRQEEVAHALDLVGQARRLLHGLVRALDH